ncbi:helix-turn-helix domain-containing protein [Sphingobium sp. SJ10-10]|uniref:TetR/AcrR family transcriptional regulator n=1 Tax=Sphingobium sp. SJ10-10 TaxID=3114999 RepID=UPI002E1925A8|nr:helix-turn-helix domain-containing protein [Sphingobium sp. SJ10-10]
MTNRPTPRKRHSVSAASRLIQAAEALFAERGIDAVSMREIATAAQCGDTNAVTYYFGSKDGLLAAIFAARAEQMDGTRGEMLDRLEGQGRIDDPLALLGILCLPQLRLIDDRGRHPYAAFMLHYATQYWSLTPALFAQTRDRAPNLLRLMGHLTALAGHVHPDIARNRILLCNMMLQCVLVRWDHGALEDRSVPLAQHVRDVMMTARANLLAPSGEGEGVPASVEDWFAGSS